MVTMQVKIEGVPQTVAALNKVKDVIANMQPTFNKLGDYLIGFFTNDVFESEGGVYGARWQPLEPKYSLWKSTRFPGRGILERTGKLRHGFKAQTARDYLLITNNVEYGKFHQGGYGVPQRVIVALKNKQQDTVRGLVRDDVTARIREVL